jgi:hypothetical protein
LEEALDLSSDRILNDDELKCVFVAVSFYCFLLDKAKCFHFHSFNVSKNCNERSAKFSEKLDVWWVYLRSLRSLLSIHIPIDASIRHTVRF